MRLPVALLLLSFAVQAAPETVAVTYKVSKENEAALQRVLDDHWATCRKLGLVRGGRELYRGDGFFLEIFTWKDASIPDDPPAPVKALWDRMNKLSSKLDFEAVEKVH
ncbi:MAG: hypothetical protein ABR567_10495 [Myxococcales bacterium]|nr:hypothetical protein [Myxococcales bacterium]